MRIRRIFHSFSAPLILAALARTAAMIFIGRSDMSPMKNLVDVLMEYGVIARNLIAGKGFAFSYAGPLGSTVTITSAYMPPGQVWLDYCCMKLFGIGGASVYSVFCVNVIFGILSVFIIGKITEELFQSKRITALSLWLAAIYPPFIYAGATFGITSSVILIDSAVLLGVIRFFRSAREGLFPGRYVIWIGGGFGLLFLFRGEAPVLLAITSVMMLWLLRSQLRKALPRIVLISVLPCVMIAPWTIRNYAEFGRFIPISSNGEFNFWRGNNSITTGSAWRPSGTTILETDQQWAKRSAFLHDPVAFDSISATMFLGDGLQWVKQNPEKAIVLDFKKAFIFWTLDLNNPSAKTAGYIVSYLATLALLFVGIFALWRKKIFPDGLKIIALWTIVSTIIVMIFFPLPRLQVIMIAGYFPVLAFGADFLVRKIFSSTS